MDSLDDIWDAPVAPRSPARPVNNERVPRGSPLFLQGSDDENDEMPDAPPQGRFDVDSLFSGVDNLPDDTGSPTALSQRQILSSSPAHHLDGDGDKDGGQQDKDAPKPKKKPMRLDEGRLISGSGFPQLMKDTKQLKIKGKGHEVYQFWTHRLYPKTPFKDTVDRVEKICHSKRMHNQLGIWRDEAHGIVNGKKTGDDEDGDAEPTDPSTPGPDSDQADYASSSSHAATRPPSSVDGDLNDSEFDDDLGAAMDANARLNARQAASEEDAAMLEAENLRHTPSRGVAEDDEAEAAWQEQHAADAGPHVFPPKHRDEAEDEDGWDVMDEMDQQPSTTSAAKASGQDDDEWDALDEMDEAVKSAIEPKKVPTVEEDAEDMYS